MQPVDSIMVYGKDGLCGSVVPISQSFHHDSSQLLIQLDNGQRLLVPVEHFVQQQDGSYYLPLSLTEVEPYLHRPDANADETLVVPVIAEELDVQKRVVETRKVRISKVIHEHETVVDEPLFRDEVEVERVLVHRPVEEPITVRYEDDTIIVPIMEEVLVVQKHLILKEELHIRKRRVETHQPQQVTLRREEAHIEYLKPDESNETTEIDMT
jgi:uncharacterized protein (TIGR02271 family)